MISSIKIKFFLFIAILAATAGCGINRQAAQIKALEDCKYRIVGAEQLTLAGTDLRKLISQRTFDMSDLPGVAIGLLTKDVPLKARIYIEITNPTEKTAAINTFEYLLLVGQREIANGTADQPVTVLPGQKVVVPVQVNSNLYNLVADKDLLSSVSDALKQRAGTESLGTITIKLKPVILIGSTSFKYPGYINITKDINAKLFQ